MTPETVQLLTALIGFNTVSRHSNLELIDYIRDYLANHGIHSHLIHDNSGQKANLLASIGPSNVAGGVVLSGHTDVVPVDGQPWSSDPFVLTEKQGRLYGRGTADMKAFIAIALAWVPRFLAAPLKRPIHLAFSYDEEIGCLGAPRLIDAIHTRLPRPAAVIVGEPTSMQAVVAHKGITALRTCVYGHEAHSSQVQRGVSAVTVAARLVSFIDDMMKENQAQAQADCRFIPPYTTLHVGTLQGGTAINIMARECEFVWDIRTLPGESWEQYFERFQAYARQLEKEMQAIAPQASIKTLVFAQVPPLQDQGGKAQELVFELLENQETTVVPFAAEAGQFQASGLPVVLCGPGAIDQAHQPDECIDLEQIAKGEAFMTRLANILSH